MPPLEGRIELDSHADTIVLGTNCVILSYTGQSCEVMPYSDTYDAITDVPVITGATLWTSPHDGDKYILIFNKALWMGNTLQHTLVNPNQLQAYGMTVQDNPFISSPLKFDPPTGPTITITTMGTIIYCNTCAPSHHELSTIHDSVTFYSRLISLVQVHAPSKSPDKLPSTLTFQIKSRHSSVSPQDLSERWFIGLKKAKDTIQNTTQ